MKVAIFDHKIEIEIQVACSVNNDGHVLIDYISIPDEDEIQEKINQEASEIKKRATEKINQKTRAKLRAKEAGRSLMNEQYIREARSLINRAVELMTPDQLGRWSGVRTWLEFPPE